MKGFLSLFIFIASLISPFLSSAELDLDKEVLVIPDTHDVKPYIWNVTRDPRGYDLTLQKPLDQSDLFSLTVKGVAPTDIREMHVFIAGDDLHFFDHLRPEKGKDDAYSFPFKAPKSGEYRFEIVFKTDRGWVDIGKDMTLTQHTGERAISAKPGDENYGVKIKLFPKKLYAEHVSTFLYDISYRGKPLQDIERMEGADMIIAAWDERMKEFVFATPKQNLGGPEVALSVVFMRPGKHAVFAQFKHNGVIRTIDSVVNVLAEPRQGQSFINLKPAE